MLGRQHEHQLLSSTRQTWLESPSNAYGPPKDRAVRALYLSQFLATWSIWTAEFSLALFLAAVFPGTLFYLSIFNMIRSLITIAASPVLGSFMEHSNRLLVMHHAITSQRVAVGVACLICLALISQPENGSSSAKHSGFLVIVFLGCIEKLGSVANITAIERDWVVVVAEARNTDRAELNASLRRLDLLSKLLSPLIISWLDARSHKIAMITVMATNLASCVIERASTRSLYGLVAELADRGVLDADSDDEITRNRAMASRVTNLSPLSNRILAPWQQYVRSPVFLASFSNAILYFTVLYFGGQMVTHLLNTGFDPFTIAVLRIGSVMADLSGTWIASLVMRWTNAVRAGFWGLIWQFCCIAVFVVPVISIGSDAKALGILLSIGIIFKRLGLMVFELATQFVIQEATPPSARSRFSTTEVACQSFFDVLSSIVTAVFARPKEYRIPVLVSYGCIVLSCFCYAVFAHKSRWSTSSLFNTPREHISLGHS